ncbi:MAG: ABC transporter permease [Elusimicrobia bacterium]|nr:ABC transporter permease [Elusimicrobiota bacterium]
MFLRMLAQSFVRGRRRKVLAVAIIALSASLVTALMNLSINVGDKMSKEMKSYGANIHVAPKGDDIALEIGGIDYNPLKGRIFLREEDLPRIKEIFWQHNIVGFAPFLKTTALTETGKRVPLWGTMFDKLLPVESDEDFRAGVRVVNPFWQVQGEWPNDDDGASQKCRGGAADPAGLLAGETLAREMGWKCGDRIRVKVLDGEQREVFLTIRGLLRTGGPEESALVAPLSVVQKGTGWEGKVQSVSVSALTVPEDKLSRKARYDADSIDSLEYDRWYCTAYVSAIAHQLEEAIPNASARPLWQVAAGEGAVIGKIQLLMIVVTIAAFIASGLGISSLMATTILERSREIGLMKALGASDGEVYLLFLSESAVVGIVGGLAGCAAGAGLSQVLGLGVFGSTVAFHPILVPVNVLLSVLVALAGSLAPSRLIAKLFPAEVLYGRR